MSELRKPNADGVLDRDVLELLGTATAHVELPDSHMQRLRAKVVGSVEVDDEVAAPYLTIRADEGSWIELEPKMHKKVLDVDENGIESYLLRLQPGASPGRHLHDSDELCIVLEGDVSFDDVHLKVGDCHIARKGSCHGTANTVSGALLFLQAAVGSAQPHV